MLPLQGAQVQSLIRELRSHIPCGQKIKRIKKKFKRWYWLKQGSVNRGHSIIYALSSVQSLSRVRLFVTPWTAAQQAYLSITNSQSLLRLMSIESVMLSNHLILYRCLLLPSVFPSIQVFSNESVLSIRWPKYWSFSSTPFMHALPLCICLKLFITFF